jgi:N-acetylmuramoyl-L-alanine amidase
MDFRRFLNLGLALFLVLTCCTLSAWCETIPYSRMLGSEKVVSRLKINRFGSRLYIGLSNQEALIKAKDDGQKKAGRVIIEMPLGDIEFTVDSATVVADGQARRLALPVVRDKDGIWAPIESTLELLSEFYPGSLTYDSTRKTINGKMIGGRIWFRTKPGETQAIFFLTTKKDEEQTPLADGGVKLTFKGLHWNVDKSGLDKGNGLIRSVDVSFEKKNTSITFLPAANAVFDRLIVDQNRWRHRVIFKEIPHAERDSSLAKRLEADHNKWALDVVVIDPGHGGKDPGAIGPTKLKEKEITLDVGIRLAKALEEKGVKTIMTRNDDRFIPLSERSGIANRSGGKLFISLHCNADKSRNGVGTETYFLAPTKTERAMEVALLENEVIRLEDSRDKYHDLTEENFILLSMAQANFTRESQNLAGIVHQSVGPKVGLKSRGVDQAGFYVLIGASMPAVLYEMAFISNRTEEKKLKDREFRQQIADGLCDAILRFLQEQNPTQNNTPNDNPLNQ